MAKDKIPMPFFTRGWLSCDEVKVLAPDVRGLWFDMICYMWESVERGVMVKPNHQPYAKDEITLMIGKDCSESYAWLDTLIDSGVCSVREDGAIYSRRMVKDELISNKRREAGKKGGDVTKAKIFQPRQDSPVCGSPVEADLFQPTPPSPPPLTPEQKERAEKAKKYKYADYVTLTRDEYAKLCGEFSEDGANKIVMILNNYKGSKGKKYKSDYMAILNWVVDRYNEDLQKNGQKIKGTVSVGTCKTDNEGYRDTL